MKIVCILLVIVMLSGCAGQPVLERVEDPWVEVAATQGEVVIALPDAAALPALQSPESGKLYLCDGYVLTVQTCPGGDLDATMRQITGFPKQQLTCIETRDGDVEKYSCVWTAAGEGGAQVGRALIMDDGNYHYAVTVMADYETAGELAETWQTLLGSVQLKYTG